MVAATSYPRWNALRATLHDLEVLESVHVLRKIIAHIQSGRDFQNADFSASILDFLPNGGQRAEAGTTNPSLCGDKNCLSVCELVFSNMKGVCLKVESKLSKQQKKILSLLSAAESGELPVSRLYPRGGNVRSIQASASRAINRMVVRGLVERDSLLVGDRKAPVVRLRGKS